MSRLQKLLGVGKGYLERLPPMWEISWHGCINTVLVIP